MDTLQATLADSATYVRYLRKRVLELELEHSRQSAARTMAGQMEDRTASQTHQEGVFSLGRIKAAIVKAVQEACACQEDERRRRLKQLQLRWHPGVKIGCWYMEHLRNISYYWSLIFEVVGLHQTL